MRNLDKKIKHKKEALNQLVAAGKIMGKATLRLSQQLDVLIVKKMRRCTVI